MIKSNLLKYVFIVLVSIGFLLFSFTIIYDLMIPDLCHYHTNDMNGIMSMFYSTNGASNGHPEPSFLNLLCSIMVGGYLGYRINKLIQK